MHLALSPTGTCCTPEAVHTYTHYYRHKVNCHGFIQSGGGALGFPPPRISEFYYDISIDLMQVLGL